MKNKILLLLSNLRGINGTVDRFKKLYPESVIIPILFSDKKTEGLNNGVYQEVDPYTLKAFVNGFDFIGVVAIYVSFMTGEKVDFIKHAPAAVKLIWSIPGGDLYNRYLRYFGYPIVYRENWNLKYCLGKIIRKIPRRIEFCYLVKRCQVVVSANCDYEIIKKYAPKNAKLPIHIYAIAYPMEKMMGDLYGQPFVVNTTNRVVIGNSASKTNNHLYVLKCLSSFDIKEASLSLIMSYGDSNGAYKNKVKAAYRNVYGDKVSFVTDYVPLDEFNRRLLTATHFIYGNWRQEAVGNILTAFYLGGKVYLSQRNPLLNDFKMKGFVVYCLEDITDSFFSPLSEDDKKHNRRLIDELYNKERAASLFEKGLESIM